MLATPKHANLLDPQTFSFKWIEDFIYYDGPLLSLVESDGRKFFLFYMDNDYHFNRWLVIEISEQDLQDYAAKDRSLLQLINAKSVFLIADIDTEIAVKRLFEVSREDIDNAFLPSENSYFCEELRPNE